MAGFLPDKINITISTSEEENLAEIKDPKAARELAKTLTEGLVKASRKASNVTEHLYINFDPEALESAIFADLRGYKQGKFQFDFQPGTYFVDKIGSMEITERNIRELTTAVENMAKVGNSLGNEYIQTEKHHYQTTTPASTLNKATPPAVPNPEDFGTKAMTKIQELHEDVMEELEEIGSDLGRAAADLDPMHAEVGSPKNPSLSNPQMAQVEITMRNNLKKAIRTINTRHSNARNGKR